MYIARQYSYGDPTAVFIMVMIEPAMSIIINMHIRVVMIIKYNLGARCFVVIILRVIITMWVVGRTT